MIKWKVVLQVFSLILIDLLSFYLSIYLAFVIRIEWGPVFIHGLPAFTFTFENYLQMIWMPCIYITLIWFEKLYHSRNPFWEESRSLLKVVTLALFLIFVIIFLRKKYDDVSRAVILLSWFFSLVIFPFFRYWGKIFLYKVGIWKENALMIGTGASAVKTIRGIQSEGYLGYHFIGFLDDDPSKTGTSIEIQGKTYHVYGDLKKLKHFIRILNIQTVFISTVKFGRSLSDLSKSIFHLVRRTILIPDLKGIAIFNSELHFLFMERLFLINIKNNLNKASNRLVKRVFDLTLSAFALIVISPLMILIALLVKLTSNGPVLFAHTRIGKDGKPFKALKFRSMYQDAQERLEHLLKDETIRKEWESSFKLKDDPRITPVGKFLRKTSLDELPQIFNILRGDMSLIGPRPVIQVEIDQYYGKYKEYYFSVLPGLSGLWQISGRSDTDYDFRVQTDVWYTQNWSLFLDIIILLRTPLEVLKRKGAY